jgi:hypothetical protein
MALILGKLLVGKEEYLFIGGANNDSWLGPSSRLGVNNRHHGNGKGWVRL